MILGFLIDRDWRFIDPRGDVVEVILDELTAAPSRIGELTFTHRPRKGHAVDTDNHLFVTVNSETGFGALTWYVTEDRPNRTEIHQEIWVTDNPRPPDFDPRVVSDPDCATFYHPRSAVPLAQVRAALADFCSAGTGDRPGRVSWVPGRVDGRRLDEPFPRHPPRAPETALTDDPWEGTAVIAHKREIS